MGDHSESGSVADLTAAWLAAQNVETIFCITGAGNLALVDALSRDGRIRLVYCHHEQAATMAAQGYARLSEKMGVVLATTGGGAANTLTGVLSAQLDSIPLLVILGNESSFHCENMRDFRAFGVQGFDTVAVFQPITKFAKRVEDVGILDSLLCEAWETAQGDRQGVAVLDFPMDLQRRPSQFSSPWKVPRSAQKPAFSSLLRKESESFSLALQNAHRPIVYIGNGARSGASTQLALELIERHNIPFFLSWSAADLVEDSHPLNMGRIGIYGDRAANIILQKSDLLLCLGTRLAIPQVGYDLDDFARFAQKWVVDIDEVELKKFSGSSWRPVHGDVEMFLQLLRDSTQVSSPPAPSNWTSDCERIWAALPRESQARDASSEPTTSVHSSEVMEALNASLPDDAVIVTDVGAGLLSGHYSLRLKGRQRLFTSQGLGEMGFGLPASLGAFFADPNRPVICLNTDGGLMFNVQELQTAATYGIPLKLFVFNNRGYGMIRISQRNLFGSRFAGINTETGVGFPDFAQLAHTFGFKHFLINDPRDVSALVRDAVQYSDRVLVEVVMDEDQQYLPRLATKKLPDGSLSSPPLEDLDPLIPFELLEDLLEGKAHHRSREIRNLPAE